MSIDCAEPLVGMSLENAAKDFGFGRLRIGAQRRVEPLGEQGRAHVDFARAGAQRQIALEPQMLKREREDGEDRNGDAADKSRWNRRAGGPQRRARTRRRTLDRLCRAGERTPSANRNRPVPAQCFNWPHLNKRPRLPR